MLREDSLPWCPDTTIPNPSLFVSHFPGLFLEDSKRAIASHKVDTRAMNSAGAHQKQDQMHLKINIASMKLLRVLPAGHMGRDFGGYYSTTQETEPERYQSKDSGF